MSRVNESVNESVNDSERFKYIANGTKHSIMSPHCCHTNTGQPDTGCRGSCKYGPYCYRHRSHHLIRDGLIVVDRFTGLSKDYIVKDLVAFLKVYPISQQGQQEQGQLKDALFSKVQAIVHLLEHYSSLPSLQKIIQVQAISRRHAVRMEVVGYACNNLEDFYTFEPLREIKKKYYYSYVDPQGHRWGFDIRSLQKLIQMGYPNPYTTEPFLPTVKATILKTFVGLRRSASFEIVIDEVVRSRADELKQRVVDIFASIERAGYTCSLDWFMSLTRTGLRGMYRQLEDIWNHRAQLTREQKREIAPPDGHLCRTSMTHVMGLTDKLDLQCLVMDEAHKLTRSPDGTQTLGFMYVLIALGSVSQECATAHPWLMVVGQ